MVWLFLGKSSLLVEPVVQLLCTLGGFSRSRSIRNTRLGLHGLGLVGRDVLAKAGFTEVRDLGGSWGVPWTNNTLVVVGLDGSRLVGFQFAKVEVLDEVGTSWSGRDDEGSDLGFGDDSDPGEDGPLWMAIGQYEFGVFNRHVVYDAWRGN